MIGLAYLVAFSVYLLISIGMVLWAISCARKNGKSMKRWGWGAAFIRSLMTPTQMAPKEPNDSERRMVA